MADIVVIVEASDRSGTFQTATFAADQGRELYVVPGDITRPTSKGCNMLLRDGHPYVDFEDFASHAFNVKPSRIHRQRLNPDEELIVRELEAGLSDGEEITEKVKIDTSKFNRTISLLELKNIVRPLGCNRWTLV